jgi:penicillin-binding protein 2
LIYDRHGLLLAENISGYTLEIAPSRITNVDATIEALGKLIDVPARDRRRFKKLVEEIKNSDFVPLKTRLTDEEVAKLASVVWRYPGVEVRGRLFRAYPNGQSAAHVLGYISRLSESDLDAIETAGLSAEYVGTTHVGKVGLEQSYENVLHGKAGFEEVEVSAGGHGVRSLSRTDPKPGRNLILSIDFKLQKLVEELYGDRRGAMVAIEPKTGEVLAFVSKPTFDPNLFIDGVDAATWQALNDNEDKPLLNRPLRGAYPPGSTYKPFMALAALTTGARTPHQTISDAGFFAFGGRKFRDSKPGGNGIVDLHKSIVVSSDTYYYILAHDMGVDAIHDFMKPWGFGQVTGIDVKNEAAGVLPSSAWKQKRYKQKWYAGESVSLGIGQGYNAFTILQLAHAVAALANDGVVMQPKLVSALEDPLTRKRTPLNPEVTERIRLAAEHLKIVKSAMVDVNRFGTSRLAFAGAEYAAAGKTGTAQVIQIKQDEKYDAKKIAERYRDHSLFICFAPADAPKIAIALIVENGGFGAQAAAPIARKALDFYLLGKLPKDLPEDSPLLKKTEPDEEMRDLPVEIETEDQPANAVPADAAAVPGKPAGDSSRARNAATGPADKPKPTSPNNAVTDSSPPSTQGKAAEPAAKARQAAGKAPEAAGKSSNTTGKPDKPAPSGSAKTAARKIRSETTE